MTQRSCVVTYSFAHFIDVSIERECTIEGDAETWNAFTYSFRVGAECKCIDCTFRCMSSTGADEDSLLICRGSAFTLETATFATKQRSQVI